jgi:enolase
MLDQIGTLTDIQVTNNIANIAQTCAVMSRRSSVPPPPTSRL